MNNERVTLAAWAEPLRQAGVERVHAESGVGFALLVHDWCKLAFTSSKSDEVQLTHETDVGYELTTALLVSAVDGSPLAPMEMHLKTAQGVLSTRPRTRNVSHLEQVLPTMKASQSWGLSQRLLHVIDRRLTRWIICVGGMPPVTCIWCEVTAAS